MGSRRLLVLFAVLMLALFALPAVVQADNDDEDERDLRRQAVREMINGAMVAECRIRGIAGGQLAIAANDCDLLGEPIPAQGSVQCNTWAGTLAAVAGAFGPTSVRCDENRGIDRAELKFNAPVAQGLPGPGNNCGSPTNPVPDLRDCVLASQIGSGRAYDLIKRNGEFISILVVDGFTGSLGVRDGRPIVVQNARVSFSISYGPGTVNAQVFPFPLTPEPRCVRITVRDNDPATPTSLRYGC